jgi:hypothetical protein
MISYSPHIVTDGLVLCLDAANPRSYPLSGTSWNDLSGNGNHGTLVNGPTFNSNNGGFFGFDGTNDRIDFPTTYISSGISMSLETWIKPGSSQNQYAVIFDYYHGTGGWAIQQNSNTLNSFYFAWLTNGWQISPGISLSSSKFNHFVVAQNGTSVTGYVDGNSVMAYTGNNTNVYMSGRTLHIGGWGLGGRHFNGSIVSPKIYNRALSANEVKQNFNATRGRYGI